MAISGEEKRVEPRTGLRDRLLVAYRERGEPMTPSQAARIAGINPNTARRQVQQLHKHGLLTKEKRGLYKAIPSQAS